MYCPKCFSDTLSIHSRGVARVLFNGKQMDTSQFLFNVKRDSNDALKSKLRQKISEFFKWYSEFQNKSLIKSFEVYSQDFVCKNGCKLDLTTKFSLIGLIFDHDDVVDMITEEAEKYKIPIDLTAISSNV